MRIYAAAGEDAVRASKLLKDWAGEGYITQEQYQRLKQETVSDLRTTNIFLRIVLFLFTLIGVGAAAALFFVVFLQHSSDQTSGIFLMIGAVVCYAAAEFAASQGRLYRYGIEEALAACSVGFLYFGMQAAFFSGRWYSPSQSGFHSSFLPRASFFHSGSGAASDCGTTFPRPWSSPSFWQAIGLPQTRRNMGLSRRYMRWESLV